MGSEMCIRDSSKPGNPPSIVEPTASSVSSTGMVLGDGAVEVESQSSVTSSAPVVVEGSSAPGSLTVARSAPDEEAQLGPEGMAALRFAVYEVRTADNSPACLLVASDSLVCVCVCVVVPSILGAGVSPIGRASRGHTGGRPTHRRFLFFICF